MMKYVVLFLGWLAYTYSTQFFTHGDKELEACIVNCSIHHEDGPIFADCGRQCVKDKRHQCFQNCTAEAQEIKCYVTCDCDFGSCAACPEVIPKDHKDENREMLEESEEEEDEISETEDDVWS
ncbi:hypothetical protein CRM22_004770 [Opisthorchis felineus]|uniref:Uncharacterized protein n=1 Tax=Opisthorchis felineus TaxID=147828 RepID=A0A4S2M016_OPIFE|nr:hypothetical protein CRM22_004770 [Opisthorchis felineus]